MKLCIGTWSVRSANTQPQASQQRVQPSGVRTANTRDQPEAGATDPNQLETGVTSDATTGATAGAI
jgi:hypothetical protein